MDDVAVAAAVVSQNVGMQLRDKREPDDGVAVGGTADADAVAKRASGALLELHDEPLVGQRPESRGARGVHVEVLGNEAHAGRSEVAGVSGGTLQQHRGLRRDEFGAGNVGPDPEHRFVDQCDKGVDRFDGGLRDAFSVMLWSDAIGGAGKRTMQLMFLGLSVLVGSMIVIGLSNYYANKPADTEPAVSIQRPIS